MTMDNISESRLIRLHPAVAQLARKLDQLARAQAPAIIFRVSQGLRTFEEQGMLYDKGRISNGVPCTHDGVTRPVGTCPVHKLGVPVTNAKPGQSYHNFGLAFDVAVDQLQHSPVFTPDWNVEHPSWKNLIRLGQSIGLTSGSAWRSFPDYPHFQLTGQFPPGVPPSDVLSLYHAGGLEAVWKAVQIPGGLTA